MTLYRRCTRCTYDDTHDEGVLLKVILHGEVNLAHVVAADGAVTGAGSGAVDAVGIVAVAAGRVLPGPHHRTG